MVGVAGHAGAREHGVDLRAASLGVFAGLEHEDRRAFAEHEAVALLVERTRRAPAGRRCAVDSARIAANAAIGSGWMTASDATAHDDVGAAGADHVQAVRDRLRARRTRRHRRVRAGAGVELERDRSDRRRSA